MKTRNGFVSNSSSSSFVVKVCELFCKDKSRKPKTLLTKKQIAWLKKYGFVYCGHTYASRVEELQPLELKPAQDSKEMMYYSVVCNEDEVIEALLEQKIPFEAACHYGHETVIYEGGDTAYLLPNVGRARETYKNSLGPINPKEKIKILSQHVDDVKKRGWRPK